MYYNYCNYVKNKVIGFRPTVRRSGLIPFLKTVLITPPYISDLVLVYTADIWRHFIGRFTAGGRGAKNVITWLQRFTYKRPGIAWVLLQATDSVDQHALIIIKILGIYLNRK